MPYRKVFAVDDIVQPTSHRCPLPPGEYRVIEFIEPIVPFELFGTVFVEGHKFGVGAEYLIVVRSAPTTEANVTRADLSLGFTSDRS